MRIHILCWLAASLVLAAGLSVTANWQDQDKSTMNQKTDREAVEAAIHSVFSWAVEKDFDLFFNTIADDADFVSVTPYDRVKIGVEAVKADSAFWGSPDFRAISHELRDLKVTFSRTGEVAWFYCKLDDINEWQGRPANWENARWTGVLEKRDGTWRVVQQHFSFAKEREGN